MAQLLSNRIFEDGELYAFLALVKSAVFIERDGVLNRVRVTRNHPGSPTTLEDFVINPAAADCLQRLKAGGLVVVVTTNQPGLSRGTLSRRDLDLMHARLRRALPVDEIMVCPHDEMDHCPCRKPKAGLITEAAFMWRVDLARSYVLSDKWQDAEAARTANCTSVLVESPWIGSGHHDFILPSLQAATEKILQLHTAPHTVLA